MSLAPMLPSKGQGRWLEPGRDQRLGRADQTAEFTMKGIESISAALNWVALKGVALRGPGLKSPALMRLVRHDVASMIQKP